MLLLDTKLVAIGENVVKLYSVDGKLWFTRASDVRLFKLRRRHHEKILKKWVRQWISPDQ